MERGWEKRGRKQPMVGNEEVKFLLPDPLPATWVVEMMALKGSESASCSVKGGGGVGTTRYQ